MNRVASNLKQGDEVKYVTMPSGILARITDEADGGVHWDQLILGKYGNEVLAFDNPDDALIAAVQTNQLFLVVCNSTHWGDFANSITIDGWELTAAVGEAQAAGDYTNVLIIKACEKTLSDLVANPEAWIMGEVFSVPQVGGNTGAAQLVAISEWLQAYFKNAQEQPAKYFDMFNTIAQDPSWNGVLFLRVNITGVPADHQGIMSGIGDAAAFNAHHLGIELNAEITDSSSVPDSFFGLIYYTDPGAPSDQSAKLQTLKVLFENSAVTALDIVQS